MKVISFASALILSVIVAHPQSAPTPSEKAKELRNEANAILRATPHRVELRIEMRSSEDLHWELYSSQTIEVAGPKRRHVVQHTGLRREYIYIDAETYMKMPDGPWQLLPDGYTGATVRSIGTPVVENVVDERKDGEKVVDTRAQSRLQVLRTAKIVETDGKTREWFDANGRLTRTETEHFNFKRKKFQRNTEVYEYDSSIRIEAPIE